MCSLSFTTLVTFIILSTSIYTEAKTRGHHSPHGLSRGSHSGHTSSGGSHSYPTSHGLSGNSHATSSSSKIHYHYHYNPPRQITYTPIHGGVPQTYPVYMGTPPAYVYEYRDSGSVYGTLLTGLALYNLGYHSNLHIHHNYNPQSGEKCKFGVKKSNGDYEETLIKCDIITSFILEEENKIHNTTSTTNTTIVTTTWSNETSFAMTNGQPNISSTAVAINVTYNLAPNGTLIPQVTSQNITNDNGTITSMRDTITVMSTTNTTTITNALDVKGKDIKVTPEMQCYMIRITETSNMKKSVPCAVLQSYAEQSLHRNSANRHVATIGLFAALLTVTAIY